MRKRRLVAASLALVVAGGSAAAIAGRGSAPRRSHGPRGIVVLLKDLSPPSQRARFEASRAVALRGDGQSAPLSLVSGAWSPGGTPEETLWIEGEVPPGTYTGFEVTFLNASRSTPDRTENLTVPSSPVRIDVPFVVGAGSGTVLVLNLRSAVTKEDPPRFEPVFEGSTRPRPTTGLTGLASVAGWESVAIFDKRTGALASLLPVGPGPGGLAIDAERARAYVAVSGDDVVTAMDLLEGRVRERIALRAGDRPKDVVLSPDGRILIVANPGSDTVSFVDPIAAIELERVAVAGRPASLLMDRDGRRAFVLPERASSITVLSVASHAAIGSIAVETGPVRARFSGRNGERILVAHAESPYLAVIDSRTLIVEQRVYVGQGARALEVDPRSGRIYLARNRTRKIEAFDPSSFLPLSEIPVPGEVSWLAVESEGNGLGVLLLDPPEVRIVGLVGSGTVARTPLGPDPAALLFLTSGAP